MQNKTNSLISEWITNALMEKIIRSKKLLTTLPEMDESIFSFISDIKDNEEIEAIKQPKVWFVESVAVDWEIEKRKIVSSLDWNSIQIGEPTETEFIIQNLIVETSAQDTLEQMYKLILENSSNSLLLCTIMHAISHMDYEFIYPYGPIMAMALLSHDDKRVVSYAIKAFSNWNSKDSLNYVRTFSPKQVWAKKEWDRVVKYIEENGDEIDGVFGKENYSAEMDTRTA